MRFSLNDVLCENQLQVIRFIYEFLNKENEASMSLHRSKREKLDILESFEQPEVQANLSLLKAVLGVE
ncbi:MAG: hypothetical protein R3D58_14405 [Saprospiraceae bacterium]|nr:hypothetical protein [Lewinellaceae bacterium]